MAFASGCEIGVRVDAAMTLRSAFGETGSFLVETSDAVAFEALCVENGASYERLGETLAEPVLRAPGIDCSLFDLRAAWSAPLQDFYADAIAETSA
jgi:hypothetical protein